MRLMLDNFKSIDLVKEFKDEDIDSWPENIAAEGFFSRGFAYATAKDGAKAAADLEKSVEKALNPQDKLKASQMLGNVYLGLLKDDEKALAAFALAEKYPALDGGAAFLGSITSAANILSKQGKHDEAIAKLNMIDQKRIYDYWKANVIAAYGDAYLAKGDKTQAAAKYKEALAVERAPKSFLDSIQKKLDGIKQ
jgi:tetratricopeptide (TPR) repeat protein